VSDAGRVTVVYIGGLGRSGSTLLDRMLGQVPGFFSAGEIRDLWQRGLRENRLCGCGRPFRECPVWAEVGVRAFGGWDRVDLDRAQALTGSVDRHKLLPLLVSPGAWPPFRRKVQRYAELIGPVYRALADVTGSRVIIDSSKAPSTAFLLRQIPTIDLRAVHLIRDSRGVAHSWNKKVVRPDTPGRTVYMHRYHPSRIGLRWMTRNAMMELLGRLGTPVVRVRYEAVVADARHELERILQELDLPYQAADLGFVSNGHVSLRPNHTVMGNPMRLQTGPVPLKLDEAWRTGLARKQSGMVTVLTRPLLRRYGYRP
jgi:hypothetical protein